jgi:hypothetical protein
MHRPAPLPAVPTILIELAWPIQLDERPIQSLEIDASALEVGRTGKLQSPTSSVSFPSFGGRSPGRSSTWMQSPLLDLLPGGSSLV